MKSRFGFRFALSYGPLTFFLKKQSNSSVISGLAGILFLSSSDVWPQVPPGTALGLVFHSEISTVFGCMEIESKRTILGLYWFSLSIIVKLGIESGCLGQKPTCPHSNSIHLFLYKIYERANSRRILIQVFNVS